MHDLYQRLIALRRANVWLARSRVQVDAKTNTSISYSCMADGRSLTTSIVTGASPTATVTIDGEQVLRWPA
jgi:hypothetical protein